MKEINKIGRNTEKSNEPAILLNDLLAEYSKFYQNVRGNHWNIQGDKFFELHSKFEELYNDLFHKIDEVAEHILTIGFTPNYTLMTYFKTAKIKESDQSTDGHTSVQEINGSLQILLSKQRVLLDKSGALNDAGTNVLVNDYISAQEKLIWMYSAYLK